MTNRIVRLYLDTPMYYGHERLNIIAKNYAEKLKDGEHIIFINRAWTKLKLMSSKQLIHYFSTGSGRRISPDSIRYIPECLGANGEIDYDKAVLKSLEKTKYWTTKSASISGTATSSQPFEKKMDA